MGAIPTNFPPVVYVPTIEGADGYARIAMHHTNDGRLALFVYSAIDRLDDFYGQSPWALLTIEDLQKAYEESPYDLLFLDKTAGKATESVVHDDGQAV